MNDYLKNYKVRIQALSPIHIGSGVKTGKKEYIYTPGNHRVIIPEEQKMYEDIQKMGYEEDFVKYIMDRNSRYRNLTDWLKNHGYRVEDYQRWKKYEMDAGQAFCSGKAASPKEISAFIKDAYGCPYVPGSSIKGMVRTALIAWEVDRNPQKYESIKREIERNSVLRTSRKECLAKETKQLEAEVLYTLQRDMDKTGNAVNDNLAGLYIGDSRPISTECLTLSQKIDYTLGRKENPLPILRESLIPGTKIDFDINIDTTICPYNMEDIMDALNCLNEIAYHYFYSRFQRGTKQKNTVWLGGGCGFVSKTILYPLFGSEAVRVIDEVYNRTLGRQYEQHKHTMDQGLGIAPHVCKCTKYNGKLYDMGMGKIEIL